jgi:DNA-binding response OmpR family regulator
VVGDPARIRPAASFAAARVSRAGITFGFGRQERMWIDRAVLTVPSSTARYDAAMRAGASILVVEDEPRLGELVRLYLEREGYAARVVTDGTAAIAALDEAHVDLVILDLMLPGLSGEEVLARIRDEGDIPVLITSAKRSDAERIAGLRMGADDYLAKPYNPHELTARVAAILRRSRPGPAGSTGEPVVESTISLDGGRLVVESASRRFTVARSQAGDATRHGRLTPAEFALLAALVRHPGAVLTRDQLLEVVTRRPDEVFDRVVDVHVANLRKKLGDDPVEPWLIETIPQTGYRLVARRDPE